MEAPVGCQRRPGVYRVRGFSTSLRASPSRFQERRRRAAAVPGASSSHQSFRSADMLPPSLSITPRLGRGGWTPRPRKPRMISVPMKTPIPMVTVTTIGLMAFGRTWTNRILEVEAVSYTHLTLPTKRIV